MKPFYTVLSTLCIFLLSHTISQATTIVPFKNLGEMAKASEAVVLAKAHRNYTFEDGVNTRFRTHLEVLNNVKGLLMTGDKFELQNYHNKIGDLERMVWGDLELKEGKTYLLFIQRIDTDVWRPLMLSYAAFEEFERNGEQVLVPFDLGTEVHIHVPTGMETPEALGVYSTNKLIKLLSEVVSAESTWDKTQVTTVHQPTDFEAGVRGTPPGHCSFLSNAPYARWPDFDTQSLPVLTAAAGDPGCATAAAEVSAAIGNIAANYSGVNLSSGGTHTFIPTCAGGGATDGEFITWVSTNLPDNRQLLVQFDDPCSEIADLSGCVGTLAIGGLYWFTSTHMADGMSWRNAAFGYVVVNNDTGTCQCTGGTDYQIMMTHELTHSLNIGHIAAATGDANMNPSCCESISALDVQCLDFIYAPLTVPVEVISFVGEVQNEAIALNWTSISENQNDFYTLEKIDRAGNPVFLGKVSGQRNDQPSKEYYFMDNNPDAGYNYYRLSQTDFNERTHVIDNIAVEFEKEFAVTLNPNPLSGEILNVELVTKDKGTVEIELFDLRGERLLLENIAIEKGQNLIPLTVENLASGVYFLKTTQGNASAITKLIKQ